ncbi:alanine racemase [Pacificimonas sp. ICDLI1SI03]
MTPAGANGDGPLRLNIDLQALTANWTWFRDHSHGAVTGAAVKANGYGLGADAVVTALAGAGCREFFVTTFEEAARLLPLADGCTVYALHGLRPGEKPIPGIVPVLNSQEQIARWREAAPGGKCDVMVDTGMNRLGIGWREFERGMLDGLNLGTLHSHLASADEPDNPLNDIQQRRFQEIVASVRPPRAALAGSAGICRGPDFAFGMTRPGLGIYGGVPHPMAAGCLQQVVRPQAEVLIVRHVAAGDIVGYNGMWRAEVGTRVAVLNIGYADGYRRGFSNEGQVLVGGERRPVIGRISMDLTTVDIGNAHVDEGDWVEVEYDLPAVSAVSGQSQYELLTGLGHRYQRRYI